LIETRKIRKIWTQQLEDNEEIHFVVRNPKEKEIEEKRNTGSKLSHIYYIYNKVGLLAYLPTLSVLKHPQYTHHPNDTHPPSTLEAQNKALTISLH
jgi:hypothetical protein